MLIHAEKRVASRLLLASGSIATRGKAARELPSDVHHKRKGYPFPAAVLIGRRGGRVIAGSLNSPAEGTLQVATLSRVRRGIDGPVFADKRCLLVTRHGRFVFRSVRFPTADGALGHAQVVENEARTSASRRRHVVFPCSQISSAGTS